MNYGRKKNISTQNMVYHLWSNGSNRWYREQYQCRILGRKRLGRDGVNDQSLAMEALGLFMAGFGAMALNFCFRLERNFSSQVCNGKWWRNDGFLLACF